MHIRAAKGVRRQLLALLYDQYRRDPMKMLNPEELVAAGVAKEALLFNVHYLGDRGLVELMRSYYPPYFSSVRLTAAGVDLVENRYAFDLQFPPAPEDDAAGLAEIPYLVERLLEEAEISPLDGEARKCLLRDVQFLRDEVARPVLRWRHGVIQAVLGWIAAALPGEETLPSLPALRASLDRFQPGS
jgi:hypothetical protein